MNLWDRLKMVGAVICLLSFVACEDPTELGKNLRNIKNIEVRYAEIPLEMGMIRVDSINTTNRGFLMVGEVNDPVFGRIKASSFTNLSYRPGSKLGVDLVYDSIILVLNLKEFYSLSSDTEMGFEVRELTDSMISLENYTSNSSPIPFGISSLGSVHKVINSTKSGDTILLRLDKTWGSKFDNFLKNNNSSLTSDTTFNQKKFNQTISNGLAFVPTTQDALASINVEIGTSGLRVYYHKDTVVSYSTIDLNFPDYNTKYIKGFTSIELDRSQSLLSIADSKNVNEYFQHPNGKVYNSNFTGILPTVKLNNVFSFFDTLENVVINRSDLVLKEFSNPVVNRSTRPVNYILYISQNPILLNFEETFQGSGANPIGKGLPAFLNYRDKGVYSSELTESIQALFDSTLSIENMVLSNTHRLANDYFFNPFNNLSRLEIESIKLKIYYTVPVNK